MCYGHMYCLKSRISNITVRLTYYQIETRSVLRFDRHFSADELRDFFDGVIDKYVVWAEMESRWKSISLPSMREAAFPRW